MARPAAKTKPTLTFDQPTTIPLNELCLHPDNVRQDIDRDSISSLAADIENRGLLQSLSVQALTNNPDAPGYAVLAGGRRWRALQLLVKQKKLAKDAPIPCIVRVGGVVEADSLAENVERVNLHPIEEFKAFKALADKGQGEQAIAAAFRVTAAVVKQRLRLANASEKLLVAYRKEDISLDQLMAFCMTDDHKRQEKVFAAIMKGWNKDPRSIKRMMAEACVDTDDRRALFVGRKAYEAAGGTIFRDLFDEESGGWFQDVDLLDRLVDNKLHEAEIQVNLEGWAWVEAAIEINWEKRRGMVEIAPIEPALTEEEEETLDSLREAHSQEEEDDEREQLEERIDYFEKKSGVYSDEQKAKAGVFISVDYQGRLNIERGYAKPEDGPRPNGSNGSDDYLSDDDNDVSFKGNGKEPEPETGPKIPDALKADLTTFHTLGLRNALADDYTNAFTAVLHAMVLDLFYPYSTAKSCLQIKTQRPLGANFAGFQAFEEIERRHERFGDHLPGDAGKLWDYIYGMTKGAQEELFAHCAGLSVNAIWEKHIGPAKREHAGQLAKAIRLDMSEQGFVTTADNYFSRVNKDAILAAVEESEGEGASKTLASMKKKDMAKEAERLIAEGAWLPELLRTLAC